MLIDHHTLSTTPFTKKKLVRQPPVWSNAPIVDGPWITRSSPPYSGGTLTPRDRVALTDTIRRLRTDRGLTQEALAARAGVSPETVRKLEQGKRATARTARLILHALARDGITEADARSLCDAAGLDRTLAAIAVQEGERARLTRLTASAERRNRPALSLLVRLEHLIDVLGLERMALATAFLESFAPGDAGGEMLYRGEPTVEEGHTVQIIAPVAPKTTPKKGRRSA